MKLGNISQSIVKVPNFFFNRKYRSIETFNINSKTESNIKISPKNRKKKNLSLKQKIMTELNMEYNDPLKQKIMKNNIKRRNSGFSDRNILTTFLDMNINNNPRYTGRYWLNYNKEKYIPNYYNNNFINKTEINQNIFPEIIDMNKPKIPKINSKKKNNKKTDTIITKENDSSKNFFNYKKYCDTMNTNKLLCPDLRNELMNDTRNLIDRINMNYDLTSWNKFDTRTTLNRFFQNEFSPISKVIKTSPNIRDKFIETLNKKASGLTTVNIQVKKNNLKRFYNKNDDSNDNKNNNEDKALDKLLDKNKSNLTKLKYNNTTNLEYNEQDKMFIKENEYITKKLNKTKLFSQFPSKTREEFNTKKIFKYKELFKINKPIKNLIQKDKYGDDNDIDKYSNKSEKNTFYKQMWTRPLHKDAFKLNN